MATLVKFRKDNNGVFAFFPQLNYNKRLYGNRAKTMYAHIGQHSSCYMDYVKKCTDKVLPEEYAALKQELESIGYKLKICK